ncbi:hypothetical protein TI39_contig4142g00003 [Zymoseptoria brevis]|uniref:Uncharacterized protein n=1 Tax=Zymoseptoria brevis TaxID=1047168 RepID=A0A0F4GFT1_9PEZI|nr:hypothetical protein TI39_contig4142g00003 [Zymoseptoria brevis]
MDYAQTDKARTMRAELQDQAKASQSGLECVAENLITLEIYVKTKQTAPAPVEKSRAPAISKPKPEATALYRRHVKLSPSPPPTMPNSATTHSPISNATPRTACRDHEASPPLSSSQETTSEDARNVEERETSYTKWKLLS